MMGSSAEEEAVRDAGASNAEFSNEEVAMVEVPMERSSMSARDCAVILLAGCLGGSMAELFREGRFCSMSDIWNRLSVNV